MGGDKVPVMYSGKLLGKAVWAAPPLGKKQTYFLDCLCSSTQVGLFGKVEEWGNLVCIPRIFKLGGKESMI